VKAFEVTRHDVRRVFDKVRSQGRNYVHETEAMEVLKSYGFHIPKSRLTTTEDECAKLSEEIGYPVASFSHSSSSSTSSSKRSSNISCVTKSVILYFSASLLYVAIAHASASSTS
jgi:acyl-CoA synthetase (NDP forming)